MEEIIDTKLTRKELNWDERACVCVVLVSGGYPGKYEKGKEISGLEKVKRMKDIFVFHAGTKLAPNRHCVTNGGRVLGVTALGDSIKGAVDRAYEAAKGIHFAGMYYRKDIGYKALNSPLA